MFWAARFKYLIIQKIMKIPHVCMYDSHHQQQHYNPQLPSDKRKTVPGGHPPPLDPELPQTFHHTILPPTFRSPTSPAYFEFEIHDFSEYFIIVHTVGALSTATLLL
jgi:hypothetical protein